MYAVIRTGNKQYRVEVGQELLVEKLEAEEGKALQMTDVLLYSDGEKVTIGTPLVEVAVMCTNLGEELGEKLRTFKYRRRHNYYKRYGHRQTMTRLRVDSIAGNSTVQEKSN